MKHADVRDLIDKMGGLQAVAALAQVERQTAWAWGKRIGRFPSDTYVLFHDELRRRGYLGNDEELPASLWGMKIRRPNRRPRGGQ